MKKFLSFILILVGLVFLISCQDKKVGDNDGYDANYNLNIYYLNDTHGAVLNNNDEIGFSRIANLVISEFLNKPEETVFITGGDIFQGQLISNASKGAFMVELFNEMQLDAFVLGNHEFDWGIEEVLKYVNDEPAEVKANFPILGANVKSKSDNQLLDGIKPYTIIERNGMKIGIIGVMGDGLERSISYVRIKDYYFSDAYDAVRKYYREIKANNLADMIIVVNHGSDFSFNHAVAELGVDAVFNGHTHREDVGTLVNDVPYMQAGSNGYYVGQMSFNYKIENNVFKELKHLNNRLLTPNNYAGLKIENVKIANLIEQEIDRIGRNYFEDEIIKIGENISQDAISNFIVKAIAKYTNADVAFHNYGGTRTSFSLNQSIKASDVFQVFPFDNEIILVEVSGSDLIDFMSSNSLNYKNTNNIVANESYTVALNDYMFYGKDLDSPTNNYTIYELNLYELFLKALIDIKNSGQVYFYSNSEIVVGEN